MAQQSSFEQLQALVMASIRPMPKETGDGTDLEKPKPAGLLTSLLSLKTRDVPTIFEVVKNAVGMKPIDDKTYFMEKVITLADDLPLGSKAELTVTNSLRNVLWTDLAHPPLLTLDQQKNYRAADGSGNNLERPDVGAGNTHYARSVSSTTLQSRILPDPEMIFDSIMAREDFRPHPTKISSLLFYLAALITHDIFDTDPDNQTSNKNSSYLDLSPLYGYNQDEQNTVRTFSDGKLKPDCFADKRPLSLPPGLGVFLIMFNRWHNHAVDQLTMINENGRFTKPSSDDKEGLKKYDNDLFQTARLITCNLYCNIILHDYVRTILNLNRTNSSWTLDPRASIDVTSTTKAGGIATGNQVSAEFNLIYRWHSCLSRADEQYVDDQLRALLKGQDPETVDWNTMVSAMRNNPAKIPDDPVQRPFAKLKRNPNNSLPEEALAKILTASIEEVAGSFGPNHVPKAMRAIEILGILRARKWQMATLNELRAHFNLDKHTTFEDINPDPKIVNTLKHFYNHPDNVELYPGLLAESAKDPMVPGSGLCTTYTISRAILSDATALVRGDRFFTLDCTPGNLTSWGYQESNIDLNVDQGHGLYKLILNAFPNSYKPNSVYAHFPFTIPSENQIIHQQLGIDNLYDYSVPQTITPPIKIYSHAAATQILKDSDTFKVLWGKKIEDLVSHSGKLYGRDYMLAGDTVPDAKSRCTMAKALYQGDWQTPVSKFYKSITHDLLSRYSTKIADRHTVNIVRDVINPAQAHFASQMFGFPVKTKSNPHGFYTEHEAYTALSLCFMYIFFDFDPTKSYPLRQAAKTTLEQVGKITHGLYEAQLKAGGWFGRWFDKHNRSRLSRYGTEMVKALLNEGYSLDQAVWTQIIPTAAGMVASQGQVLSEVLEFYLSHENAEHWSEIKVLAEADSPEADEVIQRYILEATRLRTSDGVLRQCTTPTTIVDGESTHTLKPGSVVFVNLSAANKDPKVFANPTAFSLEHPISLYRTFGFGKHACLGYKMVLVSLTAQLKVFARLQGLRKCPGAMGDIGRVNIGDDLHIYKSEEGSLWPLPTGMRVQWDEQVVVKENGFANGGIDD